MMRDNSRHFTLAQGAQGCDHLPTMAMGGMRGSPQKGGKCKMKCTHETSLETPSEAADAPPRVPKVRRKEVDNSKRLQSRLMVSDRRHSRSISLTYQGRDHRECDPPTRHWIVPRKPRTHALYCLGLIFYGRHGSRSISRGRLPPT
jgi:hypothetical protein